MQSNVYEIQINNANNCNLVLIKRSNNYSHLWWRIIRILLLSLNYSARVWCTLSSDETLDGRVCAATATARPESRPEPALTLPTLRQEAILLTIGRLHPPARGAIK